MTHLDFFGRFFDNESRIMEKSGTRVKGALCGREKTVARRKLICYNKTMRYLKDTLYYLFAEEKGKPALAFFSIHAASVGFSYVCGADRKNLQKYNFPRIIRELGSVVDKLFPLSAFFNRAYTGSASFRYRDGVHMFYAYTQFQNRRFQTAEYIQIAQRLFFSPRLYIPRRIRLCSFSHSLFTAFSLLCGICI
jgi:hypothetical protein